MLGANRGKEGDACAWLELVHDRYTLLFTKWQTHIDLRFFRHGFGCGLGGIFSLGVAALWRDFVGDDDTFALQFCLLMM